MCRTRPCSRSQHSVGEAVRSTRSERRLRVRRSGQRRAWIVHAVDGRSWDRSASERSSQPSTADPAASTGTAVAIDKRRTSSIRSATETAPRRRSVPGRCATGHHVLARADMPGTCGRRSTRCPTTSAAMRLGDVAWRGTSSVAMAIADPVDGVGHPVGHLPLRPHTDIAIYLVRPLGFEPRTNGLRVHCSAVELEARN